MAGIVALQEELGAPEECLRIGGARTLRFVEGIVCVRRAAEQVRRASNETEGPSVLRIDAVVVVLVDQSQEHRLRILPVTLLQQHLAEKKPHVARLRVAGSAREHRLRLLELSRAPERLTAHANELERNGGRRPHRIGGHALGERVPPRD